MFDSAAIKYDLAGFHKRGIIVESFMRRIVFKSHEHMRSIIRFFSEMMNNLSSRQVPPQSLLNNKTVLSNVAMIVTARMIPRFNEHISSSSLNHSASNPFRVFALGQGQTHIFFVGFCEFLTNVRFSQPETSVRRHDLSMLGNPKASLRTELFLMFFKRGAAIKAGFHRFVSKFKRPLSGDLEKTVRFSHLTNGQEILRDKIAPISPSGNIIDTGLLNIKSYVRGDQCLAST